MSDPHPADDTLGPMLDALGTLYGPETMLRRCHEKFADDPTVIAELRYELEATRELLKGDRVEAGNLKARIRQLEAVRDRLARERDHQTNRADALQTQLTDARIRICEVEDRGDRLAREAHRVETLTTERDRLQRALSTALEQVRVQNLELWAAIRSSSGWCGKHTLTGDIACRRPVGHNGQHAGGTPAVTWAAAREDADLHPSTPCGYWSDAFDVSCQRPLNHDGDHFTENAERGMAWPRAACNDLQPYPGVACQLPAGHDGEHRYEHGDKGVTW